MSKHLIGKIILGASLSFLLFAMAKEKATFGEEISGSIGIGGISVSLDNYYEEEDELPFLVTIRDNFPEGIAIADVKEGVNLNVRKNAGTSYSRVGILARDSAVIVKSVNNGWAEVESGEVKGYVSAEYLIMGEDAAAKALELKSLYATVNKKVQALNVRTAPSTTADIITKVKAGEQMSVSKALVVNKNEADNKLWVEIYLETDTNEGEKVGYVALDYVSLNYELQWAVKYSPYGANVSDARVAICDEAMKYIGTKYVWGGNDPLKGIDCSGLVNYVFKHVSYTKNQKNVINMPRVSNDMANYYKRITRSELKPGDLVFYGNSSRVTHVAIYIGNGKIVHSSTNYKGVAVSSMDFITPKYYGRVIND